MNRDWLVRLRSDHCAQLARIVYFPHAGGSASAFGELSTSLPAWLQPIAIEYPGHGRRIDEPLIGNIRKLAVGAADACRSMSDLPFLFFGHSMGGLVAFEACRMLLARQAVAPILLIVSACCRHGLDSKRGRTSSSPDETLIRQLKTYGGMPSELIANAEMMSLLLPIFRSDLAACEDYEVEPGAKIERPAMALYSGMEDTVVSDLDLQAWTNAAVKIQCRREFHGGHFYFYETRMAFVNTLVADATLAYELQRFSNSNCFRKGSLGVKPPE